MSSGVRVHDDCNRIFQQVKMNTKTHEKLQFAVFKLSQDNTLIVRDDDLCVQDTHCFTELLQKLPHNDGRYVVYDYPFQSKAGAQTSKLILLMWCPSCMPVKTKMLYASSKGAIKKMLNEELTEFQCDCIEDVTTEDIETKLRK